MHNDEDESRRVVRLTSRCQVEGAVQVMRSQTFTLQHKQEEGKKSPQIP